MKTCFKCDRTPNRANRRSHSNQKTSRTQRINLQSKTIAGKKVVLCTKCISQTTKV